eukprot:5898935-Pleurochrysis_carterae.AAC.1
MEGTTTPEPSVSRLRGAPASVVDRQQRSGSNFRGVAPWQIMRMGRDCLLYTSPSPRDGLLS